MKFATKPMHHCARHIRYVAALPWKMKNSNFLQMWKKMQSRLTLLFIHKFWYSRCLK